MFETPYQTTPCSRFDLKKQTETIRKMEINGELVDSPVPGVMFVPPGLTDLKPFMQPMTKIQIPTLECDVVLDGRTLLKNNGEPVKDDVYRHALMSAELTKMWYQGDVSVKRDFLQTNDWAVKVFINWLAKGSTGRLNFDMVQVKIFKCCAAIYYIQLHTPLTKESTDDDHDRLLVRATRYLSGIDSAMQLSQILGKLVPLNTLGDLIEWYKTIVKSPRTDQLTVGYVYNALVYTWGNAYREAVSVSLEYPPVFLAMIYNTCLQRSYTRTALGKVVEETIWKNSDREFLKDMNHLLRER